MVLLRYCETYDQLQLDTRTILAYNFLFVFCVWKMIAGLNLLHMVQQNKLNTSINPVKTTNVYSKIGCLQKLWISLSENQC